MRKDRRIEKVTAPIDRRHAGALALCLLTAACGQPSQYERNRAAMNEQLEAINASTPVDAGAQPTADGLVTPTPDQVGQQMRAAAAKPPKPASD